MFEDSSPRKRRSEISTGMSIPSRDRFRGALLGLAAGDAVGTALEFKVPGSFQPVYDMVGDGPFDLSPGEWTDGTSMALCLAASLVEKRGFDPRDQMERYTRWWKEGYMSATGHCFNIGNTVRCALLRFLATGEPYAGSTDPKTAGNGSLMRLAPVPLFYAAMPRLAIEQAANSSRTTHGAATALDACRYLAALIVGALNGTTKEELLSPAYCPVPGHWDREPLHSGIARVAAGSFRQEAPPRGSGFVVHSLEAALWAFHHTADFREGCLKAANLGEDADTTAAVYGQLAGAFYGEAGIPVEWRERLAKVNLIESLADQLHDLCALEVDPFEIRRQIPK